MSNQHSRIWFCGICGGQSDTEAQFSEYFRFADRRDSSVHLATDCMLNGEGSKPAGARYFIFLTEHVMVLGPNQPPVQSHEVQNNVTVTANIVKCRWYEMLIGNYMQYAA
jgi:hypothetical protein